MQFHGRVQRCLAAQCGQQDQFTDGAQTLHLGLFAHDDFLHRLRGNRLDVGSVCELRIGHDGGRVGVDEDHTVTLFPQCFAGLGSRIIEFTGLSDDDRARANDEDGVDVGALRHGQKIWRMKHGPCSAGDGNLSASPARGWIERSSQAALLQHRLNGFWGGLELGGTG